MKILLWIVGALAAGFLLLCLAVAMLFDANSFRDRISAQVAQNTHRQLGIGDIHLGIFPTLGARIKNVSLSNAPGFGAEPMAQVGEAQVGMRILPLLLHRRIEISKITLKDLRLNLLKQADGRSNWEGLSNPQQQPQNPGPSTAAPQQQGSGVRFGEIGGIDIDNANISYVDQQAKKSFALSAFSFNTGTIAPGKPFDFKLGFSAALADPAVNAAVQASARLGVGGPSQLFDVQNLQASIAATGQGVPGGKQDLQLSGNVHVDGREGTFKLSEGKLTLDNIVAAITLDGSKLNNNPEGHIAGTLSVAAFNPRDAFKALGIDAPQTADNAVLQQASLSATLDAAKGNAHLNNLNIKLDQSTISGSASLGGSDSGPIQFALKLDQIDLDRYMAPPAQRNPLAAQTGSKPGEGDNTPLPLDRLDGFNASGTVDIDKLKLKNLNLANARLKLAASRGATKTIELNASLYGGTLASTTRIGPGARPTLAQTLKLDSINAGPLLLDLTGKDSVSGNGNVSIDLTSAGRTFNELKRGLNGNVSCALQNGAVKGFNLAQIIRQGQALSGGQQAQQDNGQQTDFSSMSASGKISNGVLHSDDLTAASPLLRLTGAGQVDLAANTIDYTARPTVVNTAGGQGGKEMAQLQGVVIPVHITGSLNAPRYKLDVLGILQQDTVQKLAKKLGGQKGTDLVNTLQGLFGKKKQDQQNPSPAP